MEGGGLYIFPNCTCVPSYRPRWPGHTPDSCCFLWRKESRLFTGDTYYPISAVLLALPASDVDAWCSSVERLVRSCRECGDVRLSCGHGGHFGRDVGNGVATLEECLGLVQDIKTGTCDAGQRQTDEMGRTSVEFWRESDWEGALMCSVLVPEETYGCALRELQPAYAKGRRRWARVGDGA